MRKGTDDIKAQFGAMSSHVGAKLAAAFSIGSIVAFARQAGQAALETEKVAEQLGVTADLIERIQRLSGKKGLESSGFEKIIGKLQVLMDEALVKPETLAKLNKLGLAWEFIAKEGANAGEALEVIGEHLRSMPLDNATRALFSETFGKGSFRYIQAASELPSTQARYTEGQREDLANAARIEKQVEGDVGRQFSLMVANALNNPLKFLTAGPFLPILSLLQDKLGAKGTSERREDVRGGGFIPASALPAPPLNEMSEDEYNWLMGIKKEKEKITKDRGFNVFSDALSQVGGFVGGAGMGGGGYADKSLNFQERTARGIEDIRERIGEGTVF